MSIPSTMDNGNKATPALPPRQSRNENDFASPPAYSSIDNSIASDHNTQPWSMTDPRLDSQESLFSPVDGESHDRRTLLAIYIHGFMGDETSFRSFPAHVHNLLCVLLADTHVIHTKIYPRYRSKRNISFARDDFSRWLEPHEGPDVDVILLGHSMGGLVAAELAVMKASIAGGNALKHKILGTVNFDVPFLGMHPGIIKSGLASLFVGSDEPPKDHYSDDGGSSSVAGSSQSSASAPARVDTLWAPSRKDPNYNPSFENDIKLTFREGWRAAWHFVNKHSSDLRSATKQLISSHIEFGGAMANYPELKARYGRIRALEEDDQNIRSSLYPGARPPSRVRFINYYTACTGRSKSWRSPRSSLTPTPNHSQLDISTMNEHNLPLLTKKSHDELSGSDISSTQAADVKELVDPQKREGSTVVQRRSSDVSNMKVVSELPAPPPEIDLSFIKDPHTRELVELEHRRAMEAYQKALEDRKATQHEIPTAALPIDSSEEAASESSFFSKDTSAPTVDRRQQANMKQSGQVGSQEKSDWTHEDRENLRLKQEEQRMMAESRRLRGEKEPAPGPLQTRQTPQIVIKDYPPFESSDPDLRSIRRPSDVSSRRAESVASISTTASRSLKPLKERRFCNLPPEDAQGNQDPCWVRVFMENVDEVGAHCGLFFIDDRYERLVGEVATKIEEWVLHEMDVHLASSYK